MHTLTAGTVGGCSYSEKLWFAPFCVCYVCVIHIHSTPIVYVCVVHKDDANVVFLHKYGQPKRVNLMA